MTGLHPQLVAEYGTEKGAAPAAAQIAASILGLGLMASDQAHVRKLMAQAALMTRASRELEARKMSQTIQSLSRDKMASVAEGIGADLAKLAAEEMEKEAIGALIGALGRGLGGALRGAGKGLGALGRSGNTFRFQQAARRLGVESGPSAVGASGALRRSGAALQQAGRKVGGGATKFQQQATIRAPGSKPLIGAGTKLKLLGGAGVLGAGYAGMKGLQTARDYMMIPSQGSYGSYGPRLMHNVGQWGYPTY